jgi:glycerophosphoryl diester phosphodiesterase
LIKVKNFLSFIVFQFLVMFALEERSDLPLIPNKSKLTIDSKKYNMKIEGHRGAGYLEPENSIRAFKRAIELGLESVEFDIWLTKDNVPVVIHGLPGGVIELEHDAEIKIGEVDSSELHKYTLRNGEKIPTLAEVFDTTKDKICLNIEIKDTKIDIVEKALDLLIERNMLEQINFSSFQHYHKDKLISELKRRNLADKVSFGYLMRITDKVFPNYDGAHAGDSLNIDIRFLEQQREECIAHINKAKERGLKIVFWFPMEYVHEDTFYDDMLSVGVDTIITNKPISVLEYFVKREAGI